MPLTLAAALAATVMVAHSNPAGAAEAPVGLGTATSFAVLASATVTNTGPSVISGSLGVSPGTAVTGFPPGLVNNGTIHAADAVAAQAQNDVTTAYNDAAGRSVSASVTADLGGQTLVAGVYRGPTLGLTGTVTLNAQGDPDAVFIFQAGSTLITSTSSTVSLINGADPCNVFWQVGSSATLGTNSVFVGTVLALASVSANTGATVQGRLFARTAAVTLDSNVITETACAAQVAPTTTSTTTGGSGATTTTTATGGSGATTTTTATGGSGATTTTTAVGSAGTVPSGTTTSTVPAGSGSGLLGGPSAVTATTAATGAGTPTTTSAGSSTATTLLTSSGSGTATTILTGGGGATTSKTPGLAFTGANVAHTLALGLLAMLVGGVILLFTRRRAEDATPR